MYVWIDKKFFYVLFLERAFLVHKTLNFNHQNGFCNSSTLLRVVSLAGQYFPLIKEQEGQLPFLSGNIGDDQKSAITSVSF